MEQMAQGIPLGTCDIWVPEVKQQHDPGSLGLGSSVSRFMEERVVEQEAFPFPPVPSLMGYGECKMQ